MSGVRFDPTTEIKWRPISTQKCEILSTYENKMGVARTEEVDQYKNAGYKCTGRTASTSGQLVGAGLWAQHPAGQSRRNTMKVG